jgi:hypothetical protein
MRGCVGAARVELLRAAELRRVAVGGARRQAHRVAAPDELAADGHVGGGPAAHQQARRIVPERLLDHGRDAARVVLHGPPPLRNGDQPQQHVADQAGGGLVPGEGKAEEHAGRLLAGHETGQLRGEVITRLLPPLGQDARAVPPEPGQALRSRDFAARRQAAPHELQPVGRPRLELAGIPGGEAKKGENH